MSRQRLHPYMNSLHKLWAEKLDSARENMSRHKDMRGCLIEVAAQHPLLDGMYPNEEFKKRLDLAIQVYSEQTALGTETCIYVPGSLHMDEGKADKVSLSQAGCMYLVKSGVPEEVLFGEEMNTKYKGERGVYNSSDECYVASRIFEDMSFGQLHCVCSSAQLMRKALSYIQFGCIPFMHSVSCERMYHNYVDEVFRYIPILLEDNNGLQNDSDEADRLRRLRNPVLTT